MKIELLRADDFRIIRDSWTEIVETEYRSHPFLDPRSVEAALRCFADKSILLASGTVDDRVHGIAILHRKGNGIWETFAPSQLPITCLVTRSRTSTREMIDSLFRALPGYALMIAIRHYDTEYFPDLDMPHLVESVEYFKTMNVSCTGTFEEYWSSRSKNLRKSIRRYETKANAVFSACCMEQLVDREDIVAGLAQYSAIEEAGWKGKRGSAIRMESNQGRFYRRWLEDFAEDGRAMIFNLRFDDEVVASRLAILSKGMMIILKTTYDENYSEYAPGRLLLKHVLQYAFESDSVECVEFYTKGVPDQLQWATGDRMIQHHNFYRHSFARGCIGSARKARRLLDQVRKTIGRRSQEPSRDGGTRGDAV